MQRTRFAVFLLLLLTLFDGIAGTCTPCVDNAGNAIGTSAFPASSCGAVSVCGLPDGVYWLSPTGTPYQAQCTGGWALAMKVDGAQQTFAYSSAYWTDGNLYNPTAVTGAGVSEAKLAPFLDLPGDSIKLVMTAPNGQSGSPVVVTPGAFTSLRALFNGGYTQTSTSPSSWHAIVTGGAMTQPNCNLQGINVKVSSVCCWNSVWPPIGVSDVTSSNIVHYYRIGLIMNEQNDCLTPDSSIGVGGFVKGYYGDGGFSGNFVGTGAEWACVAGSIYSHSTVGLFDVYVGSITSASPSACPTPAPPVLSFRFEGDYVDSSNSLSLTAVNGQPFVAGAGGGQAAYLSIASNTFLTSSSGVSVLPSGNSPRSVSVWIKPDSDFNTATTCSTIVAWGDGSTGHGSVLVTGFPYGFIGYNFDLWVPPINNAYDYSVHASPTSGTWNHAAYTFDGTTMKTWLNGNLIMTSEMAQNGGGPAGGSAGPWSGLQTTPNSPLLVGTGWSWWCAGAQFSGAVDNLFIYDRALSSSEIAVLAAPAPVAVWTFDSPSTLTRNSVSGESLYVVGGAGWTSEGASGGGLLLSSFGDALRGSPSNLPVGNSAYTISMMVKMSAACGGACGLIGWGGYGSTGKTIAMRTDDATHVYTYWYFWDLFVTSPVALNDGSWHQIASTYDGTTRMMYIDGTLVGSDQPGGANDAQNANFGIGVTDIYNGDPVGSTRYAGLIDSVYIYNVALTQQQLVPLARIGAPDQLSSSQLFSYTQVGTFLFTPPSCGSAEVVVVAGGGSGQQTQYFHGATRTAGGGGAGGVQYTSSVQLEAGVPVTVVVGAGGTNGGAGESSSFGSIVATGGGQGGAYQVSLGAAGGSGGGGGNCCQNDRADGTSDIHGGASNLASFPGWTAFGHAGGEGIDCGDAFGGGGGGGAGAVGAGGTCSGGGPGGDGVSLQFAGTTLCLAGGGGGGSEGSAGLGGNCGGGIGGSAVNPTGGAATQFGAGGGGAGRPLNTDGVWYGGAGYHGMVSINFSPCTAASSITSSVSGTPASSVTSSVSSTSDSTATSSVSGSAASTSTASPSGSVSGTSESTATSSVSGSAASTSSSSASGSPAPPPSPCPLGYASCSPYFSGTCAVGYTPSTCGGCIPVSPSTSPTQSHTPSNTPPTTTRTSPVTHTATKSAAATKSPAASRTPTRSAAVTHTPSRSTKSPVATGTPTKTGTLPVILRELAGVPASATRTRSRTRSPTHTPTPPATPSPTPACPSGQYATGAGCASCPDGYIECGVAWGGVCDVGYVSTPATPGAPGFPGVACGACTRASPTASKSASGSHTASRSRTSSTTHTAKATQTHSRMPTGESSTYVQLR